MADVKRARREAEKAAREALSGTLVGVAGDLGAALAGQHEAADTVQAARVKAEGIIEAARREATALIEDAERDAATAAETYAAAWAAAKQAGWTPAQLRAMGYDKPPTPRKPTPRDVAGHHSAAGTTPTDPGQTPAADVA